MRGRGRPTALPRRLTAKIMKRSRLLSTWLPDCWQAGWMKTGFMLALGVLPLTTGCGGGGTTGGLGGGGGGGGCTRAPPLPGGPGRLPPSPPGRSLRGSPPASPSNRPALAAPRASASVASSSVFAGMRPIPSFSTGSTSTAASAGRAAANVTCMKLPVPVDRCRFDCRFSRPKHRDRQRPPAVPTIAKRNARCNRVSG